MKGKILLVAGIGIGYVLGARAGRERYEQIKAAADKVWNSAPIQHRVDDVQAFVKARTPDVVGLVADGAKKLITAAAGGASNTRTAPARTTSSTSSSGAKASTATARKAPAKKAPAKKPATRKPAATASESDE